DDAVLERLAKGHTRADFLEALSLMRAAGLPISPTFIPFTPWTTADGYRVFLRELVELGLDTQVAPIQLAIRLLIPQASRLLDLPEMRAIAGPFDAQALVYPWQGVTDDMAGAVRDLVHRTEKAKLSRREIFRGVWQLVEAGEFPTDAPSDTSPIPYLTEPWY